MGTDQLPSSLGAIACAVVFIVTFLAGDIAGILIEAHTSRRWKAVAPDLGFEFDSRKRRSSWLSRIFFPILMVPENEESPFCYTQLLRTLSGTHHGLDVSITDFTVWNMHSRTALAFRATLCMVKKRGVRLPGEISLVKSSSILLDGVRHRLAMREFEFPHERDFSRSYVLFGKRPTTPWIFTPDLRSLSVQHRREIDCLLLTEDCLVFLWVDKRPERFRYLVDVATKFMEGLLQGLPMSQTAAR